MKKLNLVPGNNLVFLPFFLSLLLCFSHRRNLVKPMYFYFDDSGRSCTLPIDTTNQSVSRIASFRACDP